MTADAATATIAPAQLWSASPSLSPRVRRLRDQFWSFYERDYTNQVRAYSTGTPWDVVYSIWSWTNVPEVAMFQKGFRSYLLASSRAVPLPEGFWDEPLVVRQALFFREVATRHLPVQILEGELVVGSHFSTALSRCLNREEAEQRDRAEEAFLKEWHALNDVGVGNCGAVPGHLVPDYPKVVRVGWKGIQAEAEEIARRTEASPAQRNLARAVSICADGVRQVSERYAMEAERAAAREQDPARRSELTEIARICRATPWLPPRTFPEALQAL
ncbi:MAG: hypothetical protein NTY23_14520, partial [Chloroflexi bacterium]|nr:hypothetical protein [Chloroflexota bacterium]